MARKGPINPFSVLLILVGVAFCLTASAYGLMTYRAAHATAESLSADRAHPLWIVMDSYGNWALLIELALLALCTFAAIGSDAWWERRKANARRST